MSSGYFYTLLKESTATNIDTKEKQLFLCGLFAGAELGKDSDLIHLIMVPISVLTSILLFWLLKSAEIRLVCMQERPQRKKGKVIGFKNY